MVIYTVAIYVQTYYMPAYMHVRTYIYLHNHNNAF